MDAALLNKSVLAAYPDRKFLLNYARTNELNERAKRNVAGVEAACT